MWAGHLSVGEQITRGCSEDAADVGTSAKVPRVRARAAEAVRRASKAREGCVWVAERFPGNGAGRRLCRKVGVRVGEIDLIEHQPSVDAIDNGFQDPAFSHSDNRTG